MNYKGYTLSKAKPTGGKAGKGYNKTSTIQIIENVGNGYVKIVKSIRFKMSDSESLNRAYIKARNYIDRFEEYR